MSRTRTLRASLRTKIGLRVEELRKGRSLSRQQLAILLGLSDDQVSRIEAGEKNLDLKDLTKLAVALGCDVEVTLEPRAGCAIPT